MVCLRVEPLSAQHPFQPYLNGAAPLILQELSSEVTDGVRTTEYLFYSRTDPVTGDSSKIYSVVARPEKPGRYPGLLVLHGGGGQAEMEKVKKWAAKGYIALSLDEPGIANPEKVVHSEGTWKTYEYGENRFVASPDIRSSVLFDAVIASLQGFYLLRHQEDIIPDKIGVVGISWGGYLTTMLSGLVGDQLSASFSVYGAGFFDEGSTFNKLLDEMNLSEREIWLQHLDAGRRAHQITAPFFIAAAANDNWFYPPSVMKTLTTAQGPVNHLFSPNDSHKITLPGGTETGKSQVGWTSMEEIYFDYYLKDEGKPLPKISQSRSLASREKVEVSFEVESRLAITQAQIFYSIAGSSWTEREWIEVKAFPGKAGAYSAQLPTNVNDTTIDWFACVSDARPVTVSGALISIPPPNPHEINHE